jgi:DNA-binding response OmpR family regulator
MGAATLTATFDSPIPEIRPATVDRILVIEDDEALRKILRRLFTVEGYDVDVAPEPYDALEMLRQRPPAAVILDLERPGTSGCDLCKIIANLIPGLPLLILSASSDEADKVLLLELGADDYVTIPFSPRELVARLRALIRRTSRVGTANLCLFEDVAVDFYKMEITRGAERVPMTSKEFKMLEFLTNNAERVVSRDELLDKVWGYQSYPCTRTVDTHMLRLRQKLEGDPSRPSHLLTVHGHGYKFVP